MRSFFLACSALLFTPVIAQLNISLVGHLSYQDLRNSHLSNLWAIRMSWATNTR